MEVYIGTIIPWSIPFAPVGWAFCDGRLLAVQDYQPLYSLIGTTYGGDGRASFALPDLRGRSPIGTGESYYGEINRGTLLGNERETIVLTIDNLPPHTHTLDTTSIPVAERSISTEYCSTSDYGTSDIPQDNSYLGAATEVSGRASNMYRGTLDEPVELAGVTGQVEAIEKEIGGTTSTTGESTSIELSRIQPSLVINYIIAITGTYPPRPY